MYQAMIQRYEAGCMMLMRRDGGGVLFLGTAFLVHPEGYLMTAAHLVSDSEDLVAVPYEPVDGYTPLTTENVRPIDVSVARVDETRNVALLRLEADLEIGAPDHIIGNTDHLQEGTYLLTFGFSFGHLRVHNVNVMHAMLSFKALSLNGTRLLVFDTPMYWGGIGGPLVNADDGRVVGVLQGRFDPLVASGRASPSDAADDFESYISYAVAVDYGAELIKAEGLEVI
jgi:serine protease Do